MRVEPKIAIDWRQLAEKGLAPQISKELASSTSVIKVSSENDFSFNWSHDGNSVALLYKQDPITLVSINERLGYSKSVNEDSGLVNAWSQLKYDNTFK